MKEVLVVEHVIEPIEPEVSVGQGPVGLTGLTFARSDRYLAELGAQTPPGRG